MSFDLKLASRLENIAPFHVMELAKQAALLEQSGRSIIHMGIGEPDFTAPQIVIDAAAKAMAEGKLQYTPALGLPSLREAISKHYCDTFARDVPAERIIVTSGASAALLLACAALIELGDEVLMPDPSYPCNRHFVSAFEGVARMIPSGPDARFQLTEAMVKEHWNANTRGVLLASPSNPTGTSITTDELQRIVEFVAQRGGFTVVDEIYQGLSYDAAPTTALSISDDVIVVNSFSKYFNMTGWRLGWLVVPQRLVPAIEKLAQNLFICASAVSQYAGLACFEPGALDIFKSRKAEFKRRRDFIVPAVEALGFKVPVKPDGAFYVYMNCANLTDDADTLSRQLLNETGVVIVPGLDFGAHTARSYLRLSYATSFENLQAAVERMRAFLKP